MPDKQWYRDKIAELEIKRQECWDTNKIIPTVMLGSVGLYIAVFSIYFNKIEKYVVGLSFATFITILLMFILILADNRAKKRYRQIRRRITHNYDVLLDRKNK